MALVQKLNVVLTVEDELVNAYLDKGYNIIDENGRVIKESIPNDPNQLKMMVAKLKKENEELKAKLAEKEIASKKVEPVKEEPKQIEEKPTVVETPKEEVVELSQQKSKKKSSKK